jgi:glutamyl-tRNA reductase
MVVHLDQLSRMTDATLLKRKQYIPQAEAIIEEVKGDFIQWLETRKFAPVIKALKKKLKSIKDEELNYQSRKISNFDPEHADVISDRIIQKITKQFANHLKESDVDADGSLELIQKVFQLQIETP